MILYDIKFQLKFLNYNFNLKITILIQNLRKYQLHCKIKFSLQNIKNFKFIFIHFLINFHYLLKFHDFFHSFLKHLIFFYKFYFIFI